MTSRVLLGTPPHTLSQVGPPPGLIEKLLGLAEVIFQVAFRIFFIMAHVAMAAAIFPFSWHVIALPIAAVGSGVMASFLFPEETWLRPISETFSPVMDSLKALNDQSLLPAHYPAGSPVGYKNKIADSAFNATAHFFDSNPKLAEWLRRPLGEGEIPTRLIQLLSNEYGLRPSVAEKFLAFVHNYPERHLSARTMFFKFLEKNPEFEGAEQIRDLFNAHDALRAFYKANDEAVRDKRAISQGNSAVLRNVLTRLNGAAFPDEVSADEVSRLVLDHIAPRQFRSYIETTYPGLPQVDKTMVGLHPLHISEGGPKDLQALVDGYCTDARRQIRFSEAPSALHLWIKRVKDVPPPAGCYNRFLRGMHKRYPNFSEFALQRPKLATKGRIDTPIQRPEEISIPLKDGKRQRYQLKSYVTHLGKANSGYYVSGEIRGEHRFRENDTIVTLVETEKDQAHWNEELSQADLLCYLPVVDLAPKG